MFEEVFDSCRSAFPLAAVLVFMPVVVLIVAPVNVANAAHEFTAYRTQQYDLHGSTHGCRNALVSSEARTLESSSYMRKCVIIRSSDLTQTEYLKVQDSSPSAILILVNGNMSEAETESFMEMEEMILSTETNIPIFFAPEDKDLVEIYDQVSQSTRSDKERSALQAIIESAPFVGYQIVAKGSQAKSVPNHPIVNIQGVLHGQGDESLLPTIAFVAHYDAFGVAPHLSYGANSDASGVVALLELGRILGKLYKSSSTQPKHNTLFLLSGGGKFNYQGSKRWLEDAFEESIVGDEQASVGLLSKAKLVVCLDSLAGKDGKNLHMHVSKPPSKGTVADIIHQHIETSPEAKYLQLNTSIVHKKIRLQSEQLAWEHERYSMKKLHAVTLSSMKTYKDPMRTSILDTKDNISVDILARNIAVIVDATLKYYYGVEAQSDSSRLVNGDHGVQLDRVKALMNFLTSQPRPAQGMDENHRVVLGLEADLQKHLDVKNVHKTATKADKRDPDFLFYDESVKLITASVVRSAVFDLYVTLSVVGYISAIYVLVMKFQSVLLVTKKVGAIQKVKVH